MVEDIFKLGATDTHIYYVVRGSNNKTYDVLYNILKKTYHCDCANVRLTDCKHIKKLKKSIGEINESQINNI